MYEASLPPHHDQRYSSHVTTHRRLRRTRTARHPAQSRLAAEAVGSAFLVMAVIGSGIMARDLSPDDVGLQLFENAAATAGALIALIIMFGTVSGSTSTRR